MGAGLVLFNKDCHSLFVILSLKYILPPKIIDSIFLPVVVSNTSQPSLSCFPYNKFLFLRQFLFRHLYAIEKNLSCTETSLHILPHNVHKIGMGAGLFFFVILQINNPSNKPAHGISTI